MKERNTLPMVFVSGMFRSGTTLMARMLNSHPDIAFASDPFAPLFKCFRNRISEQQFPKTEFDKDAPLDDYYFNPDKLKAKRAVQAATLKIDTGNLNLVEFQKEIGRHALPYSPAIVPLLDKLQGNTFEELLESGCKIIADAYGNEKSRMIGMKHVWTDEFVPHVLKSFPDAKAIHIVRDPRAICASKNCSSQKYPWLFLIRQWRKSATFTWMHNRVEFELSNRIMQIRYEDLVSNPEKLIREMCEFIEIDFHPNLTDPTSFVNGDGKPWKQNSLHFEGKQKFNTESISKWRSSLTAREKQFIEALCCNEMKLFDYQPDEWKGGPVTDELIRDHQRVKPDEMAKWIIPYRFDDGEYSDEMNLEKVRSRVLWESRNPEIVDKERFALFSEMFNALIQV